MNLVRLIMYGVDCIMGVRVRFFSFEDFAMWEMSTEFRVPKLFVLALLITNFLMFVGDFEIRRITIIWTGEFIGVHRHASVKIFVNILEN